MKTEQTTNKTSTENSINNLVGIETNPSETINNLHINSSENISKPEEKELPKNIKSSISLPSSTISNLDIIILIILIIIFLGTGYLFFIIRSCRYEPQLNKLTGLETKNNSSVSDYISLLLNITNNNNKTNNQEDLSNTNLNGGTGDGAKNDTAEGSIKNKKQKNEKKDNEGDEINELLISQYLSNSFIQENDSQKFTLYTKKWKRTPPIPKITVIIPVYNGYELVRNSVISIKYQNMENIYNVEIILIDNGSDDNNKTVSLLDEIKKEFYNMNIKLILTKQKVGYLFLIAKAVLNSKGEYITILNQGDLFLKSDLFNNLYSYIKKNNYDILQFQGIEGEEYEITNELSLNENNNNSKYIYQPKLKELGIKGKLIGFKYANLNNIYELKKKIIKTSLFERVINVLGKEIYSKYVMFYYENILTTLLFKYASNYKLVSNVGYFFLSLKPKDSPLFNENLYLKKNKNQQMFIDKFFYLNTLFDSCRSNSKEENLAMIKILNLLEEKSVIEVYWVKKYLIDLYKKIIDSELVYSTNKKKLKSILKKNYNITSI